METQVVGVVWKLEEMIPEIRSGSEASHKMISTCLTNAETHIAERDMPPARAAASLPEKRTDSTRRHAVLTPIGPCKVRPTTMCAVAQRLAFSLQVRESKNRMAEKIQEYGTAVFIAIEGFSTLEMVADANSYIRARNGPVFK